MNNLWWPADSRSVGEWQTSITDEIDGWRHTSLRIASLNPGEAVTLDAPGEEFIIVPIEGSYSVALGDGTTIGLGGRMHVFAGPTDVAYLPEGTSAVISATGEAAGRIAVCGAVVASEADASGSPTRIDARDVPVELRGAGQASREVRNFGVPGVLDAQRIIACEVVTPAGNWSSWPAHKHDEERPGEETELEEIYWFDVQPSDERAPRVADPVGYLRVHTQSRDLGVPEELTLPVEVGGRAASEVIDELFEVRSGDTVLVPRGWHGPAMAPPGYDLYYLNVMAGPGPERAWLICDDPAHAWVRETWPDEELDIRLPMGGQ